MASAGEKALHAAVKKRVFDPVYYLFGDDDFLKESRSRELIDAAVDSSTRDFNLEVRRASELDPEGLDALLGTPPMMADRRVVDLRDVAESTATVLRPLAAAKGLTIEVSGTAPVVEGDRERLGQVVSNLVDNAVKYTAHGGVHLHTWQDGAEAGISVTDTGPGIPMEELHRVFGRFYRTDTARTRSVDGSGLGLAIAEEIVHAHRGRIWAERDEDGGTRVSFALPLAG